MKPQLCLFLQNMKSALHITFLGTGTSQGVPVIACECEVCSSTDTRDTRLRSSVLISDGKTSVVIDPGPDFRQQMLTNRVKTLDAVLVTHGHKDHIGGMDDLRAFNYVTRKPVDVYAAAGVHIDIRREFFYAFAENRYPGVPDITLHNIGTEPFRTGSLEFIPIPVMHHQLQVLAFRTGGFAYVTDASEIPESSLKLLHGLDVLVINALRIQPHVSHFHLSRALGIIEALRPAKAYLTHISHRLGLHSEVEKLLPPGVFPAYDNLSLQIL